MPKSPAANHSQPCRLPEAMPLNNAPILQPKASRAPYPSSSPPATAATSDRIGTEKDGRNRPARAAARNAPAMMPKFITEVTSANTLWRSALAGVGQVQNSHAATSMPPVAAIFAPHSPSAKVIDHGWPASASVSAFNSASATAPHTSGHGPRSSRPMTSPAAGAAIPAETAPNLRRSMITLAHQMVARTASWKPSAGAVPSSLVSETGPRLGSAYQNGACIVPIRDPAMNAARATAMRTLPPPTVNRVPEAQPPPNCMPMPNRNAPTSTEIPTGAMAPATGRPNNVPPAITGRKMTLASASMTIWARSPAPRPSDRKSRHAEVNPNSA